MKFVIWNPAEFITDKVWLYKIDWFFLKQKTQYESCISKPPPSEAVYILLLNQKIYLLLSLVIDLIYAIPKHVSTSRNLEI